jgi:glycerate 2-kinase
VLTARALASSPRAETRCLIAAGKAADAMAAAAIEHDRGGIRQGLIVAAPSSALPSHGDRMSAMEASSIARLVGGHPVPTAASEDAGRRALTLARSLGPDDRLLVLLSGGASALMAAPVEGVTLEDKRRTTGTLLRAGADIHALNTVRKHVSAIKGGRLAAATRAACEALAISDVVGDDLSVIASGPTVADSSRFQDALDVLRRFGGEEAYPQSVVRHLRDGASGRVEETPKPGDARLARATTTVIGSRRDAMSGAVSEAEARGYRVVRIDDPVIGEARTAAVSHLRAVTALAATIERPTCIVSSGETTVQVTGRGKGGRNQEFVLAASVLLDQMKIFGALTSAGTDGIDGPTDAAGAYGDSTTIDRARDRGLAPDRFLTDNNSYAFFEALGDLIHTGPTRTNVGDLQVILLA